jgi:hypothetical protein
VLDENARVIGINYALAEQPKVKDPVVVPQPQHKPKPSPTKPKPLPEIKHEAPLPPKPTRKTFMVRLKRTATLEETRKVEAEDLAQAEREALEAVKREPFDVKKAQVHDEIVGER